MAGPRTPGLAASLAPGLAALAATAAGCQLQHLETDLVAASLQAALGGRVDVPGWDGASPVRVAVYVKPAREGEPIRVVRFMTLEAPGVWAFVLDPGAYHVVACRSCAGSSRWPRRWAAGTRPRPRSTCPRSSCRRGGTWCPTARSSRSSTTDRCPRGPSTTSPLPTSIGGASDGTVLLRSRLGPEAQAEADVVRGFPTSHVGVLSHPDALA